MNWYLKTFQELTNEELYELLQVRVDIFVVEQACAYRELDNLDRHCLHYFLRINGEIGAYVRLLPKGVVRDDAAAIGRVCVVKKFRGNGYATKIMEKAIAYMEEEWKEHQIYIQAQQYLKDFYSSLGFKQQSTIYDEDGIPHIDMLRTSV